MPADKRSILIAVIIFSAAALSQVKASGQRSDRQVLIDSLQSELVTVKTDTGKVLLLAGLSGAWSCKDSLRKLQFAEQASALAGKIHWVHGVCIANIRIGDFYQNCAGNYPLAIRAFERVVEIAIRGNNLRMQCRALNNLGLIYQRTGDYEKTLGYYNEIIKLVPGRDELISTWGNIGVIYTSLGDFTKALTCYETSLKIVNEAIISGRKNNPDYLMVEAGLLTTMADIYVSTGEYDKAMDNYERVVSINKRLRKKTLACFAFKGMGFSCLLKKDFTNAILNYRKALTMAKEAGLPGYEEAILDEMANAYLQQGADEKAIDCGEQSLKLALQNKNRPQLAKTYTSLGRIYSHEGKYLKAIEYLRKSVAIAGETGARDDEKNAWEALSTAYGNTGQTQMAFTAFKQFIALRDSIYNANKARELTRLDMQGEFDRKQATDSVRLAAGKKIAAYSLQRQRVLTFSGFGGLALMLLLTFFIYRNYNNEKKSNTVIRRAHETIKAEQQVSEGLLLNILPAQVAEELKQKGSVQAKHFDDVTILFTDFVNFTSASERMTPRQLVEELDACFKAFDDIIGKYRIEKIKTVGDAYLAAAGLPYASPDHAEDMLNAALEIRDFMMARRKKLGDMTFGIRLGISSGSVVAGIVGVKKFAYDIWGDTVNTAARIEQSSEDGKINIGETTYLLVKDKFSCTFRGELEAKNKGRLKMYYVDAVKTNNI